THYLGLAVALPRGDPLVYLPVEYTPTVNDLADLLADAMRRPLTGSARRPEHLHLRANPRWEGRPRPRHPALAQARRPWPAVSRPRPMGSGARQDRGRGAEGGRVRGPWGGRRRGGVREQPQHHAGRGAGRSGGGTGRAFRPTGSRLAAMLAHGQEDPAEAP